MKLTLQALALCQSEEQTLKTSALLYIFMVEIWPLSTLQITKILILKQEMVRGPMDNLLSTHQRRNCSLQWQGS